MKTVVEKAIKDDKTALWEAKFPLEYLLKKKREAGSIIFGMQYQNNAELAKGEVFKLDWIKFHNADLSGMVSFYQGVDPAVSLSSRADYFAVVTVSAVKEIFSSSMCYVEGFHFRSSFIY
ncbi:MAG: hypothetical protein ABIH42_03405 [Planctomycetota bacterium]